MSGRRATAARAVAWSLISFGLMAAGCSLAINFKGLSGGAASHDGGAGSDGSSDATTDSTAGDGAVDGPVDSGFEACADGYASCGGDAGNDCVDLQTDVQHCGDCATACSAVNDTPTCTAGQCSVSCDTGYADCDNDVTTGCEVDTTSDVQHCGDCATACSTVNNTPSCANSKCVLACDTGYADCDNDVTTGCEVDTTSDVQHCGDCATACSTVNNTPSCTASKCVLACNAGFGDCDNDVTTGCEVNLKTDGANCGTCGHSCEGGACKAGVCQPVVVMGPVPNPSGLAIDANNVYFTSLGTPPNNTDGIVYQAPRHGGTAKAIATGQKSPTAVAVVGNTVYFTNAGTPGSGFVDGSVASVPIGGTTVTTLRSNLGKPWGIAADSNKIYWLENIPGTVRSCDPSNCAATTVQLASGQGGPRWLALSNGNLFWTNYDGGSVMSCAASGCGSSPTVLDAPGAAFSPDGIAANAQRVYWTNLGGSSVQSVPVGGGAPSTVASVQSGPTGVALDGTYVYWTNATGGQVMKATLSGGTPVQVATAAYPTSIVADATQLFWTNFGNQTIVKLVK